MFKDFIEYRKSKKAVKRELIKVMSNTLPTVNKITSGGVGFFDFLTKLINGANEVTSDEVIKYTIDGVADALKTSDVRVIEMLQYIMTLSQEDITRLISVSAMKTSETMKEDTEK